MDIDSLFTTIETKVDNYLSLSATINNTLTTHSKSIEQLKGIKSIETSFPNTTNGFLEDISLPNLMQANNTIRNNQSITSYITPLLDSIEKYCQLDYLQVHSSINDLINSFLSQRNESKEDNCDSIKEIRYANEMKYIGRFTIHKDEKQFQTITKEKFGILYYKDDIKPNIIHLLIGHFSKDIFIQGMLIQNDLIYIGNFNKTETTQIFNGIMINFANELFLGTKTDVIIEKQQTIYEGIVIDRDKTNSNMISLYTKTKEEGINQSDQTTIDSCSNKNASTLLIKKNDEQNDYTVFLYAIKGNSNVIYDSRKYFILYDDTQKTFSAVYFIMSECLIYNGPISYDATIGQYCIKNKGIILYSNNDIYFGHIENEYKQGYGEYYSNESGYSCKGQYFNDIFIEGEVKGINSNFKANGLFTDQFAIQKGKIEFDNNNFYEGDFDSKLKYNGKGKYNYSQETIFMDRPVTISYEGYWNNGLKNGKGKFLLTPKDNPSKAKEYIVNYANGIIESID